MNKSLLCLDTFGRALFGDCSKVCPVVVDCLSHATAGDSPPEDVGILDSEESRKCASVRTSIADPRRGPACQITKFFQTRELDVLCKVRFIGQCLLSGQEPKILGRQIWRWKGSAIVAVL